jgi:HEAT repeat protein
MAKSRKLEQTLSALAAIQDDRTSDAAIATFRNVLTSHYSVAVAQAAKQVGEAGMASLESDLVAAFERFLVNPVETDTGCVAKYRIAEALYRLGHSDESVFLQGIRHVQLEPVWGGKEDTAVSLRGVCALGLVKMNYPDVLNLLADLLADSIPLARSAAVKAIAYHGYSQGVPLLRLKVRMGDRDPQVLSDCFTALLQLAPSASLEVVAEFLTASDEQTCELAALALGESRLAAAFDSLRQWWQQTRQPHLRKTGLLAIAMLRQNEALTFLLKLIETGNGLDARDAIAALSLYQSDELLWQQVRAAAAMRGDPQLVAAIETADRT